MTLTIFLNSFNMNFVEYLSQTLSIQSFFKLVKNYEIETNF